MVFCLLLILYLHRRVLPGHDNNKRASVSWEAAAVFLLCPGLVLVPSSDEAESTRVN